MIMRLSKPWLELHNLLKWSNNNNNNENDLYTFLEKPKINYRFDSKPDHSMIDAKAINKTKIASAM